MMTKECLDYIYNYTMDDIENSEAMAIEYAVNNLVETKINVGTPTINGDYTQCIIAGTIKVIEVDLEYHYYFLTIGERGTRHFVDINEKMSHWGDMSRDLAVLYLLSVIGLRNISAYHIHEGYLVRAVRCRGGKFRLKQVLSYGIESLNKEARHAIGDEKPMFDRYKCACGHSIFYIQGETVGMDCPYCNQHISL